MRTYIAVCLMALWLAGCGGDVPTAPPYVYDLLESTEVKWDIEHGEVGGHYEINHPGESNHTYIVTVSVVTSSNKHLMYANGKPHPLYRVKHGGWSDIQLAYRDRIDWSTAHIWCEVRVYDASGRVVFHGIKRSVLFPGKPSEEEAVSAPLEERLLLGLDKRKMWSITEVKIALNKPGVSVSLAKGEAGAVLVHAWPGNDNDYNTAMMRLDEGQTLYEISDAEYKALLERSGAWVMEIGQ